MTIECRIRIINYARKNTISKQKLATYMKIMKCKYLSNRLHEIIEKAITIASRQYQVRQLNMLQYCKKTTST